MFQLKARHIVLLMGTCLVTMCTSVVRANTDANLSPYFFVSSGEEAADEFPLKNTEVKVTISGVIADVVVTQEYANTGASPINGSYIFPASTRAAVHGMSMRVNDDIITAKIQEKEEAKETFTQAKKEGKSASLLEQQRPNVFSMDVANIMPGDVITIELKYTELLVPTDNIYQFVYPTVVGPRYSSQSLSEAPAADLWVENPYLQPGADPKTRFSIEVDISSGLALQELVCTSHSVEPSWESASVAAITLKHGEPFGGDRDFILNYRLAGEEIETGMMLYEKGDENFFLLMVQPPEKVAPEDIPAREYIFIVDVSGSMSGFPLNTAKELMANLIGTLRSTDRFNVLLFAGSSQLFSPVSLPATGENLKKATRVIDKARGGGGTELLAALKRAMALPGDEAVSRTIVMVTDGYITAEKDAFLEIYENRNRANVFAFGIGSSVNRYLIEGIAKAGGGEPFVVTRPAEAAATAKTFRSYIEAPVLTDIAIDYEGFDTYDVEPRAYADLFARRPLVVIGKYHGEAAGNIRLSGVGGSGDFERNVEVKAENNLEMNKVLPFLWARKRLSGLADYNVAGKDSDTRAEIVSLGLTYNLLSEYTSFVAVHEQVRNPGGAAQDVKQPLVLPKNVSALAVGNPVRKVPEPGLISLAFVVLFLGFSAWRKRSKMRLQPPAPGKSRQE